MLATAAVIAFVRERASPFLFGLPLLLLLHFVALSRFRSKDPTSPPSIPDLIPYVTNTWQYLSHIEALIRRVK